MKKLGLILLSTAGALILGREFAVGAMLGAPALEPGTNRTTNTTMNTGPLSSAAAQEPDDGLHKAEFPRRDWRRRLMAPDLDEREAAFDQMIEVAGRSPEAVDALREWSEDPVQLELAWTARLALREVERRERELPSDPLGLRLDPFAGFGGLGSDPDLWFEDTRRRLDELQQRMGGLGGPLPTMPGTGGGGGVGGGGGQGGWSGWSHGQGVRIEQGPDGVRVEVDVNENGERTTKTYEAESLEELLEANPELREQGIGEGGLGGLQFGLRFPDDLESFGLGDLGLTPRLLQPRGSNAEPRTDVLGVMMREPAADEVMADGLEAGVGLLVDRILPGTIAEALELRRGDVLIRLGEYELRSGGDVARALAERGENESIELELIDVTGQHRTRTWSPAPPVIGGDSGGEDLGRGLRKVHDR